MDWDTTQLRTLATDLGDLAAESANEARKVIQKGALEIKKRMQVDAERFQRNSSSLPRDISYETEFTAGGITAEIGPVTGKGHVGSLALLYFGNSKTGPVLKDPVYALEAEAKVVEEYLGKIGDKL